MEILDTITTMLTDLLGPFGPHACAKFGPFKG